MNAQSTPLTRADVNRANAALSTGPKSVAGRARSSQNSTDEPASLSEAKIPWAHGLYSRDLITPREDPAEFDALRASLRREHQPANTTEEILVDELAQSFWRMRRFRHLEAVAWAPANVGEWIDNGLMTLVQRAANSAERSFHKTLASLAKLQKERGFVPQKTVEQQPADIEEQPAVEETGFVPQKTDAGLEFFDELPEDLIKRMDSLLRQADSLSGSVQTAI